MGRNRKRYKESFKIEVAKKAIENKETVAEIATQYEISPSLVSEWKKAFLDGEFDKEKKELKKELAESKKELEEAHRTIGKAMLEIQFLKKKKLEQSRTTR